MWGLYVRPFGGRYSHHFCLEKKMTKKIAFIGSKEGGKLVCEALCKRAPNGVSIILCPDDKSDARSVQNDFRLLAEKYALPFHVATNSSELMRFISQYQIDIGIVHGWYSIIRIEKGTDFYGFHYAPLPKYRGNAPLVWQIINGENIIGVSFFKFNSEMDEGPLIAQKTFSLDINDTIGDALSKANVIASALIEEHIAQICAGSISPFMQADIVPSYCGKRLPQDGRIDWKISCVDVHNFIRAQSHPYPGAFSVLPSGHIVRIWKSMIEDRIFYGVPGSVVEVGKDWLVVACGNGALRISCFDVHEPNGNVEFININSLNTRFI